MILGKKLKQLFYKWKDHVDTLWSDEQYLRAILVLLLPSASVGVALAFLIKGALAVGHFLYQHAAQFFIGGFAICLFIAWLDKRKSDNIELERKEQEIRERQNYSERLEAAQTKDATYVAQAKVVFSVARELAPLGIVPPATLSNIYSPGRTISKADGTVNVSLFLLQKGCETVDVDLLKHTLQTKIDQRLQAGEFPGIPEQHVYRGRVYSGFVIDMVRDSTGGFVEVYTVLVDDLYCRYRENRELNKYRLIPSVDRRDTDY